MKRKPLIIVIIIAAICVMGIYWITRPKALGSINHSYSEEITTTSNISFSGETGEKIKFSFRSNIASGDLDIVLYNSFGNEVYTLDKATELEAFFTLDSTDTYTLAAECDDFIGKYEIELYKAD